MLCRLIWLVEFAWHVLECECDGWHVLLGFALICEMYDIGAMRCERSQEPRAYLKTLVDRRKLSLDTNASEKGCES